MNYSKLYSILILLVLPFFWACEDIIDVNLDAGEEQLIVDAWLTDQAGSQSIRLSLSQPYFDNSAPLPVSGATVLVRDDLGQEFSFLDPDNDGEYTWEPSLPEDRLGSVGRAYTLVINTSDGEEYQATSQMNRLPKVDSLVYEFREEELGNPEGYYAELFARDSVGAGDCYWIRTFKNEVFQNRGQDINVAYDAGFSAGGNVDGLYFITPIREGINTFIEDEDDEFLPPYELGDSIYVEIYSITEGAFNFFQEVQTQLTNGGLFAVPTSNVRTNLINQDPNSSKKALGYFGTSAVAGIGTRVREE